MLKIGFGREIITPKKGTLLAGYPSVRPAEIVNDDLTVDAVCIRDGNKRVLMISACIVSIADEVYAAAKNMITDKLGDYSVILTATHTHSGPVVATAPGWGEADNNYISEIFLPGVLGACTKAVESARDALVGIGMTESDVGINRREIKEDGTVKLGFNPWGLVDKRMYVISAKEPDGTPICNIVHYGCHGTSAPGFVWDSPVTRDWSGVMTDRLETYTDAPTAYFNGAEGDIAPRTMFHYDKNKLPQMLELGGKAGLDAIDAFNNIREYQNPELCVQTDTVTLEREDAIAKEDALARLKELEPKTDQMWDAEKAKLKAVIDYHEGKLKKDEALTFEQTIVALGEIVFVPFPFEQFTEISIRLAHFSPFGYTLSLSNANGAKGYLPNEQDIVRGGYEIWSSRNIAFPLAKNSDTNIINENLRILRTMKG